MNVQLPTTVGLDLSDRVSTFHVERGDGQKLSSGKVASEREPLQALFERWKGCRLVLEAGGHSPWVSRLAAEAGMEVLVANPRKIPLISKNDRKTDQTDAELLAEMGRTNPRLLHPITHRSQAAQFDLAVPRARTTVVRARTSLINHVRSVLKSNGLRAPTCSPESFPKQVSKEGVIPQDLAAALRPLVSLVEQMNGQIRGLEEEMTRIAKERYPAVLALQQIPGVGPVVSLSFALTLEDPKRFKSSRDVGGYLGLVPRKKDSGESSPQLKITKAGDVEMRRLLVIAANYILGRFGPDCDLRRFGLKLIGNGTDRNAKKRARVAVARKLAVLMLHLWRTGQVYDPFHHAKRQEGPFAA
jgi:transposase